MITLIRQMLDMAKVVSIRVIFSTSHLTSNRPKVQDVSDGLREYSSAVGVLSSAFHVRVHILRLLGLFFENQNLSGKVYAYMKFRSGVFVDTKTLLSQPLQLDCERFPFHFKMLARELKAFVQNLKDLSEFADAAKLNHEISIFVKDLEVRFARELSRNRHLKG